MPASGLGFFIGNHRRRIYDNKNADVHIRAKDSNLLQVTGTPWPFVFMKPFEAGTNIEFKELEEKTLITAKNTTRIKEGNFELEAETIIIEAGPGIKIASRGKDTLVISASHTKMEEAIFNMRQEMNKRLEVIEAVFLKIVKDAKK